MPSFELEGIFKGAYPMEEVTPTFSKRIFAIQTTDDYSPTSVFELHKSAKKDNTGLVAAFEPGDAVKVHFNWNCNKHESRWYNNIVCWKIEKVNSPTPPPTKQKGTEENNDDLPF